MNDSAEIFSTPKLLNGEGDGIKNITVRRRMVPSCRKFNANVPPDEEMRIRIGHALSELQGGSRIRPCLKKAQTVAEITPTKSKKLKKRPPIKTTGDEATTTSLHATPRLVDEETPAAASTLGRCPRERAVCVVYQRLLLCVWRRCKERLATLTESCGRQQDQINQLVIQVDVLKSLRNSESQKRNEALNESQQLKKKLEILDEDNNKLNQQLRNTQEELEQTDKNLNLRTADLKKCTEQIAKMQELRKKKKEERLELMAKISTQEYEILKQNSVICQLEEKLKMTENNLLNSESNYRIKQEQCNDIIQRLQTEASHNCSLNNQVKSLQQANTELEFKSKELENQLEDYSLTCEELIEENVSIRYNLHEVSLELSDATRKTWFKSAKKIACLSLFVLRRVAYVMLPAYLNCPIK